MSKVDNNLVNISKFLCFVLRHRPESIDIKMDENGWVDVNDLISRCSGKTLSLSREVLDQVVETDDKKRFTYSRDGTKIRAAQGHSIAGLNMSYESATPPDVLYHGTASRFIDLIKKNGLLPGLRLYVHLTTNRDTAMDVGKRYGQALLITIDAKQAFADGINFYQAENGVWLTNSLPLKYLNFS